MQIKAYQFVQDSMNYDRSKWSECESKRPSHQSNILEKMDDIRENHLTYISELATYNNEVGSYDKSFVASMYSLVSFFNTFIETSE